MQKPKGISLQVSNFWSKVKDRVGKGWKKKKNSETRQGVPKALVQEINSRVKKTLEAGTQGPLKGAELLKTNLPTLKFS